MLHPKFLSINEIISFFTFSPLVHRFNHWLQPIWRMATNKKWITFSQCQQNILMSFKLIFVKLHELSIYFSLSIFVFNFSQSLRIIGFRLQLEKSRISCGTGFSVARPNCIMKNIFHIRNKEICCHNWNSFLGTSCLQTVRLPLSLCTWNAVCCTAVPMCVVWHFNSRIQEESACCNGCRNFWFHRNQKHISRKFYL